VFKLIVNILPDLPLHKKSKEVFSVLIRTLVEEKAPLVRSLARKSLTLSFINPLNYSSTQALVNRFRRFFNSHKWNFIEVQLALAKFILKRINRTRLTIYVLTDFTYLKDKWRLLAFAIPVGGRALPILIVPVRNDAFANLRWKSEVDLLIENISLLLPLLPKGTVFIFDREFTYPKLMEFLKDNGMHFVVRLKKTVYVDNKPLTKLPPGIYENVTVHKIRANVYLRGYDIVDKKEDFYAYVSSLPKEKLSWELYKKRMKIEQMFRDEKNELNLELLSYVDEEDILGRWLTVFMGVLLNIYLISKIKGNNHTVKLLKEELEKGIISFIKFGLSIITDVYSLRLKISKKGRLVLIVGDT
jgi:hypothetical protein